MNQPIQTHILATLVSALAAHAGAGETDDPHLSVIPRTPAEQTRVDAILQSPSDFSAPEAFEALPGGATSIPYRDDENTFAQPSANMSFDRKLDFELGNSLFEKLWVSSPASTKASDGLGPLYNARSCQRCHVRDGRGHPPGPEDENAVSMFLRASVPGPLTDQQAQINGYHGMAPEPSYGFQLQDFGLAGLPAEYTLRITYQDITVPLSDGEIAHLRAPTYHADDLGYGPLHPNALLSPRVAPQMIGLGLLEAIPAADILAAADPNDSDGDGISGRANMIWSPEFDRPLLGRFGLKAGSATVREQSAAAFSGDIGISTPMFQNAWGDCTDAQAACRAAPHGDGDVRVYEVDKIGMDLITFYSRNLSVPARTASDDPDVLRGKEVFYTTGCPACHRPKFVTHRLKDQPEQSFQLIWPYSDLLLHDMGEGLADHRPEARATGREWRTPPLWGLGRTQQVSGHTYLLHDGRARSILEAILWHGGEAMPHREAVISMQKADRAALIRFLESL